MSGFNSVLSNITPVSATVYGSLTGVRQTFDSLNWLQKVAIKNGAINSFFKKIDKPVSSTRLLSFTGIIYAVPTICQGVRKITRSSGEKRTDSVVITILAVRTFANSSSSFFKGLQEFQFFSYLETVGHLKVVCKVAISSITPLWYVGSVLSIFLVVKKVRQYWTMQQFSQQLNLHVNNSKQLQQFLETTKPSRLAQFLQVDAKHLQDRKVSQEVGLLFQKRIQATLNNQRAAILADTIYVLGTALILINPTFALGHVCKGLYTLWLPSNFCFKALSKQNFSKALSSLS